MYGSLAPGKSNHSQIESLNGKWIKGTIEGILVEKGWGQHLGFPGLLFEPKDQVTIIQCLVFFSEDLKDNWKRLDQFEGEDYERILIPYKLANGTGGQGNVYALKH